MRINKTMGSICSNQAKDIKPPADLSELLQQTEKVGTGPLKVNLKLSVNTYKKLYFSSYFQSGVQTPWLSEFKKYCSDLDTTTKVEWRTRLLDFVLESRTIIKLSKEAVKEKEKEDTLKNLMFQLEDKYFPEDGGIGLSDSALRERLISDLQSLREDVKGAQGVKQGKGDTGMILHGEIVDAGDVSVLSGRTVTVTSLASTLQEVYLDPSVWDKLDKLYLQFLRKNPSLPSLAVILSIL